MRLPWPPPNAEAVPALDPFSMLDDDPAGHGEARPAQAPSKRREA